MAYEPALENDEKVRLRVNLALSQKGFSLEPLTSHGTRFALLSVQLYDEKNSDGSPSK